MSRAWLCKHAGHGNLTKLPRQRWFRSLQCLKMRKQKDLVMLTIVSWARMYPDNCWQKLCNKSARTLAAPSRLPSLHLHITASIGQGAHLLVGIHKQQSVFELFFLENCVKLFPRGPYSFSVTAIYHIDDGLRVRVVTSPVRTYACLTSQVPHLELDVFVCDRLHVKSNSCKAPSA